MFRSHVLCLAFLVGGMLVVVAGCPQHADRAAREKAGDVAKAKAAEQEHPHKPGAHNGIIVSIGADSYHAEAVFAKDGMLRLYTLGQDESRILEVKAEPVEAWVTPEGELEAVQIELKPQPQTGDAPGKTSLFVGQLPKEMWGKKVTVTVTNFRIGDERFRLAFSNLQESASHDPTMPKGASGDEERKLYLEPGGIYTQDDIKANGNITASEKFKGIRAKHDMNPKPGSKICPITDTLADPRFMWIVNGKTYEFCCPPCIDEFVTKAKTDPSWVKEPHEYIKQGPAQTTDQKKDSPKVVDPAEATILAERAKLKPEDRKLVEAQEWCVQSKERLGSMGGPIKLVINNTPVYLCCEACRAGAMSNPDTTLGRAEELKKKVKEKKD